MSNGAVATLRTPEDIARFEAALPLESRLPGRSVFDVFVAGAQRQPERTALTMLMSGAPDEQPRRVSYAQLLGLVRRAANLFAALGGPRPGVAYMLPSLVETHATLWGAETAGYAVPINFLLQPAHIAELLEASGARILVALGPHPQLDIWQKALQVQRAAAVADAAARGTAGHAGRSGRARLPRRTDGAARRPAHVRRAGTRRRRGGVLSHRRHDRCAEARGAHAPRPAGRGARRRGAHRHHARRRDHREPAAVPRRRHDLLRPQCAAGRRGTADHVARRHAQPGDGRGLLAHRAAIRRHVARGRAHLGRRGARGATR